ncbi:hypothetical protein [Streptomyces sp. NRRL WC-3742]|uniref:hypothetical protein n=1 Tax=Streptomyces sp. NRRL WC-3742 TaxID=1463934 RepID=UPI0004CA05E5|nr:hypothetical protein [Streptomyces sp. NRRL WC-3742]
MTNPLDCPGLPDASHYDLARVYAKYGSLPPADHAHLLALLAIADALHALTPQPEPTTPTV